MEKINVARSMKLLRLLDEEFGFDDIDGSGYKKISEQYDTNTNEYVMLIEYRVRRKQGLDFHNNICQPYPLIQSVMNQE